MQSRIELLLMSIEKVCIYVNLTVLIKHFDMFMRSFTKLVSESSFYDFMKEIFIFELQNILSTLKITPAEFIAHSSQVKFTNTTRIHSTLFFKRLLQNFYFSSMSFSALLHYIKNTAIVTKEFCQNITYSVASTCSHISILYSRSNSFFFL